MTTSHIHVILAVAGFTALSLLPRSADAVRGIRERDYLVEQSLEFQGGTPVLGEYHTLSFIDTTWPRLVTFNMKKVRSFLVTIEPIGPSASVVMLVSHEPTPRLLTPVWAHDDLREPVHFWTDSYWTPTTECNPTGCPRIQFQVTQGTVGIVVTMMKKSQKAYIK